MSDRQQLAARSLSSRILALVMVVVTLLLPVYGRRMSPWMSPDVFTPVAVLLTLVLVLCLDDGAAAELGLRPRPIQGWAYWFRLACWFGLVIVVICLIPVGLLWAFGQAAPIPRTPPAAFALRLFLFCVFAPVVEEVVYRAFLTHALAGTVSDWGLIATSGLVFGLAHVLYGNPSPDNLIAGFFLQWSFLKSRTLLVPMSMHGAGNALALTSQVMNWHEMLRLFRTV